MSHRWVLRYGQLVHGVRLIANTTGNECPTVKGLNRRRPQFLREAAGELVNPQSGNIHITPPGQVFPAQTNRPLQLAGGCNDTWQRNQVVNGYGVCISHAPQQPGWHAVL